MYKIISVSMFLSDFVCHKNDLIEPCVNLNLEQVVSLATFFSGLKGRFLLFFLPFKKI